MSTCGRRSAFDQMQVFSFEDAARALVFDQHGWMVTALPTGLTPEGAAYHAWLDVLQEAIDVEPKLNVSAYDDDPDQKLYIQREHFKSWCQARGMSPWFLFCAGDEEVANWPFMNKGHANYAPELAAAVAAWLAMYGNGNDRPKQGSKQALQGWLTKSCMEFGDKAIERMASVITPADRKKGGAIKSGCGK